jgi:hypothetical protein
VVLEQGFGENCQFFMNWAVAAIQFSLGGKKLFQNQRHEGRFGTASKKFF